MDTIEGVPAVNTIYNVDIFDLCAAMPPGSVDCIASDLPYGTTACAWDTVIPFAPMWAAFKRIIKPRGAIVLTASQPFTSALVMSNPKMFRYEWMWDKVNRYTNYGNVSFAPLKRHENILVFCGSKMNYFPQMAKGEPYTAKRSGAKAGVYANGGLFPKDGINLGERWPHSIIAIEADNKLESGLHPTQKPVDLFRYLIRTYTLPGELVFDPTCGSGTTAVAARAEGRNFIVGDSSPEYVAIAQERLRLPFEPHVVAKADKPIPRPTVQVGDITLEQQVMFE
jgi:site-specific DNA-methyltransferase (adenine-specific)